MATFTNLENAHVFSKAVITPSMSAAAAGNTSAHTIQSKDTWAEAVPFLEKSDLSGVSSDKVFKLDGYGTVKFHYKKNVYCLINSNNNDIPSNGYVGKIIDSEGNTINQFISPTDVVNNKGQMATVYQPSLYNSKGESMPLSDYIINPSNGLVYDLKSTGNQGIFATSATDGKTEYKLSFFTYEGAKLDTTITNIKGSIDQNKEELSGKIDKVETDYKAADTVINTSISNLSSELSGKIDKVETDYKAADTVINASITNLSGNISSHTSNSSIHVSPQDRELWNKGGNMTITGDDFIKPGKTDAGWSLSLNNSTVVGSSIASNVDGNKKVPTVNAVTNRVNDAITLHERNKNHLEFNQISFALSGGHLSNKTSNVIKESPTYTLEYSENENINPSEINYTGLIIKNKSSKGLNAFFRKLTIKKVQPINVKTLYAHITRSSQRDITNGLLDNKEYILTVKADIRTSGEITLNFGNKLIISKEYWYGIEFTEFEATTSTVVILNYNNFANVNHDPSVDIPSYPSLMTNKVLEDGEVADITYNIPCVMEFEDYEIPTSNTVKNYVDSFCSKVEELPSVYTGNNEAYLNCYGFEYTKPSENIIFDKIEIKFAKNLDNLTKPLIPGAPEISPGIVENNICKIIVAKVQTPEYGESEPSADDEIEIATSDYNTNISDEVNLSQFKFSKNIILEKGWNYRFYFYDKNDNLFAASVIANTVPAGDTLLPRHSVANRWLSERYDYWGAWQFNDGTIALNGLAVKLINSVQKHFNDEDIHITEEERERWDKGGSAVQSINGDDFIEAEVNGNTWDLSLNVASDITDDNQNIETIKNSTVPTSAAVISRISEDINDHTYRSVLHMGFGDQQHSKAGGLLRTLISEKIEPSNQYTFEYPPYGTTASRSFTKIYLDNRNHLNGFIKEITFTNSSCEYDGDIYVKINELPKPDTYYDEVGRFIGIFKFESSREGGLKVVFGNDFKVDSEHDYYFRFYNTSEIDEDSDNGNVSLKISSTTNTFIYTPVFYKDSKREGAQLAVKIVGIDYNIPTVNAVKKYVDTSLVNPTMYLFPDLPLEEREYYMIFDAWQNPVYISEKFKKDLTTGDRLFDYRPWEKFHIDMPYLETQSERMFHNNLNLISFKSDLSSLTRYTGFFHGDNKLQYVDIILTDKPLTDGSNCFTSCNKLKYVKLTGNNPETINTFLSYMPMNTNVKNKKLIIGKNENGKFVKYEKTDIPGDRLNSLIEAGWIFNN